jgi:hypothetical protein
VRWFALLILAGCGRIGFGSDEDGLVAYYPLDTITHRTTPDTAGGHTAICESQCPFPTTGHVQGAMQFTAQERLYVPSTPDLNTTSGFTVALWMRMDASNNGFLCPATKAVGPDQQNSWTVCMNADTLYFATSEANSVRELDSVSLIPPNGWHHVAIRWDGTVKWILIDGVVDATNTASTEFDNRPISIGADQDFDGNAGFFAGFPGAIDELRIYNRALSDDEIATLAR